jgi:hypothetical protein
MKHPGVELEFEIKAYEPATIPMARLAEYMSDLARLLGEEHAVHFVSLKKGSTKIVHRVESEAYPSVRERTSKASAANAPEDIRAAYERIEQRLKRDNAKSARLSGPDGKLLEIKISPSAREYPTISKHGELRGIVTRIGGKGDWVPVHLEDFTGAVYICEARRDKTKELARYYLAQPVQVDGLGRWRRTDSGKWELENFRIHEFSPVTDVPIQDTIARLRDIPADWDSKDFLAELRDIRYGRQ